MIGRSRVRSTRPVSLANLILLVVLLVPLYFAGLYLGLVYYDAWLRSGGRRSTKFLRGRPASSR